MEIVAFLPAIPMFWLLLKFARKGWRLFCVLFLAAIITGCASTSNKFEKSPCACDFTPLNTGNHQEQSHA